MNYFAHGRRFLDDPYFLAGTAVPDWLSVVDRSVRMRRPAAADHFKHEDGHTAAVARGIAQHLYDDAWFHQTRAFTELSSSFTVAIRDRLGDSTMQAWFLGHILVELLLDDSLRQETPEKLDQYYSVLEGIDNQLVANAVELIGGKRAGRLSEFIDRFIEVQFLYDYADDARLLYRLNQVMHRVGLEPLPSSFCDLLPRARARVTERKHELLEPPAAE